MTAYTQAALSDADLFELTGVEQASAQCRALDRAGIRYIKRRDGKPRTTWGMVEAALSESSGNDPDFAMINGVNNGQTTNKKHRAAG